MIRILGLVLVLTLLAGSALGDFKGLWRAFGFGPPVPVPVPGVGTGTGVSWRTPLSDGYIGYGYGR